MCVCVYWKKTHCASKVGGDLGGQFVQFRGFDTGVNAITDLVCAVSEFWVSQHLLCQSNWVDVERVEIVAEWLDATTDLVELHFFTTAISLDDEHFVFAFSWGGFPKSNSENKRRDVSLKNLI